MLSTGGSLVELFLKQCHKFESQLKKLLKFFDFDCQRLLLLSQLFDLPFLLLTLLNLSTMAFMTPIVNKRYDLYDQKKVAAQVEQQQQQQQSLNLHLKSLKLVNKLVRLVINGNGKSGNLPKKTLEIKSSAVKSSPPAAAVPVVKITPSPPISSKPAPVVTNKSSSTPAINIPKSAAQNEKSITTTTTSTTPSTKTLSPPPSISRPIPHLRRTLRDTATNRVYSYSVSIPNYVAEENEEELEEEERISASYRPPFHHHHHHQFISSSAPNCSSSSSTSFEDHQSPLQVADPH